MSTNNQHESIHEIERSIYQALVRTSSALYRAYVLCPPDDQATRYQIEGIWSALTVPKVAQDEQGHLLMETPVAQVYGRWIHRLSGYDVHAGVCFLAIDAEYEQRFGVAEQALAHADAQLAAALRALHTLLIILPVDVLADIERRATNAQALLGTLRQEGH